MTQGISDSLAASVEEARARVEGQEVVAQVGVDALLPQFEPWKAVLKPLESDERLELVDASGATTGVFAPRWLCHTLGLRHRSVHVLLRWKGQGLQAVVLQIRSPSKAHAPLHLDISVGGHVKAGAGLEESAYEEMQEELGLIGADLRDGRISEILQYSHYEKQPEALFYNQEYCVVYEGRLNTPSLDSLSLTDGEVVGLYLCPEDQLGLLRDQPPLPMAIALEQYLKRRARR